MDDALNVFVRALIKLVEAEYPEGRDLGYIARRWGKEAGLTDEEIDALVQYVREQRR